MMHEFDMTDLGKMCYFLGIEVVQSFAIFFIGQKKYAQEVLERFVGMANCNSVLNPIVTSSKLVRDVEGFRVDSNLYK